MNLDKVIDDMVEYLDINYSNENQQSVEMIEEKKTFVEAIENIQENDEMVVDVQTVEDVLIIEEEILVIEDTEL